MTSKGGKGDDRLLHCDVCHALHRSCEEEAWKGRSQLSSDSNSAMFVRLTERHMPHLHPSRSCRYHRCEIICSEEQRSQAGNLQPGKNVRCRLTASLTSVKEQGLCPWTGKTGHPDWPLLPV